LLIAWVGVGANGCGLEALVSDQFADTHRAPVTIMRGSVPSGQAEIGLFGPDGAALVPDDVRVSGTSYEVELPAADYEKVTVVATYGNINLSRLVPEMAARSVNEGLDITPYSTAVRLALVGSLTGNGTTMPLFPACLAAVAKDTFDDLMATGGPPEELVAMVERLVAAGDAAATGPTMFQDPVLSGGTTWSTVTSAINPAWFSSVSVDIDGIAGSDEASVFDIQLVETARVTPVEETIDPVNIRVILETDFSDGRLDDNCNTIDKWKWVQDAPGKQMYFVGGIEDEDETLRGVLREASPVYDAEIDVMLGNQGGNWTPNRIPMFDDGTNGDRVAGDNIWTIFFDLPRGMRIGYKYTWGTRGQLWTGTEEWPGFRHILEVVDENGDGFVYRQDDFGDETTNKSDVNLNLGNTQGGFVFYDSDVNSDGIFDTRERKPDADNDCVPDADWVTVDWIAPAIIGCGE
jgi:hypothetical protein